MRTHPRSLMAVLAALLLVTGCTGDPAHLLTPLSDKVNAPALPADMFPGLPGRGSGVSTSVEAMAGDGATLLMVATIIGRSSIPVLRSSTDGGASWQDGRLSEQAAAATVVGEETLGVAAVARVGAERQWLALGRTDDTLIAWTSRDAHTWERSALSGIDAQSDGVTSVAGLNGGGFVAVGYAWKDSEQWPRVWTSADGVSWTVHKLPGQGWLSDVAASGDEVVAVGANELQQVKNGRSQYSLLFTSSNRGSGWKRRAVHEPRTSGNFTSSLDSVVATAGGFMVGGDFYDDYEGTYRPLLLQSTDLANWFRTPDLPALGRSSGVGELVQAGDTTVAIMQHTTNAGTHRVTAHSLGADRRAWRADRSPTVRENATVVAGAASGDAAIVAVQVDRRPNRVDLWTRSAAGSITPAEMPPPDSSPVNVQPSGLFVVDGTLAAYGSSQGADVWWASGAAGFAAPTMVRDTAGDDVSRISWNKAGGYLALADRDRHVFVLHSADGDRWKATSAGTFNKAAQYHWADLQDATWAHGRWVVVGTRSTNGDVRTSALVATSTNGLRWTAGRPTKVTARGDWWGRTSPLDDLHGLENRGRSMQAVTALDSGLLAVGSFDSNQHTRPAAWLSSNNTTWRLVALPSGGYSDAQPERVQRVGAVVVALGWGRPAGATRPHRVIWRSSNNGRTWSIAPVKEFFRGLLLASGGREFVQVVLADDQRSVTLLRSADGRSWAATPLTIDGLTDGMQVDLLDAVVTDAGLHVLLRLDSRLDGVTVVQTVPL